MLTINLFIHDLFSFQVSSIMHPRSSASVAVEPQDLPLWQCMKTFTSNTLFWEGRGIFAGKLGRLSRIDSVIILSMVLMNFPLPYRRFIIVFI